MTSANDLADLWYPHKPDTERRCRAHVYGSKVHQCAIGEKRYGWLTFTRADPEAHRPGLQPLANPVRVRPTKKPRPR